MITQLKLFAMMLTLACCGYASAQETGPEPLPRTVEAMTEIPEISSTEAAGLTAADLEAWVEGFMSASLNQAEIAGAVVSVVKGDQLLFSRGYGLADVEAETPMDPERTLVRVGSTSKLFTWTAVMQLVEQGRLNLDEDINQYLDISIPEGPGDPVTMNHLMTHRGGFEEGLREVLITDPASFITSEQYLKAHPRPRIFAAGEVPAYSNYGTALAGYIVERVSGEDFDDYIERHILAPLEMNHSTFRQPLPEPLRENLSKGYMSRQEPPRDFEMVSTAPAGSLTATANDMANFMIMHLRDGRFGDHSVLQPETARLMHSASAEHLPGFATMAHGFFRAQANGRLVLAHGGDTVVFHTDMNLVPEEDVGIFVSFNSRGARDAVYGIREQFFRDFMDRYFPAPEPEDAPAIAEARQHAQEIAGHYQSSRRIETAFLKLLYLLTQEQVSAHEDGTLSLASRPDRRYREVAPDLWRQEGGEHALHITRSDGRVTIVDSANPVSVLQSVPALYSASVTSTILLGSVVVLLLAVLAWPVGWYYRRHYRQPVALSGTPLLASRLVRLAALADIAYLIGWYFAFQPIVENQLDAYGPALDPLLRSLQICAVIPIAGAGIGLWHAWLTLRSGRSWRSRLGSLVLAAALTGIAWIAWVGQLISFNLEY
ncbi:serine hydrolase domain-containing protein [Kineobactrum salinum]|uniref:Beta-lactamase family protein n=1 Tax=Kineobactrum salinum TaxID=2708301 RepID=A0A6C0UAL2_9GAMM|nr:serine hydrolase domain-containing protein [Kineobactrum salinum]QIB66904.1 beta-lactamase family protein [Kineobactrum salinum]